MSSNYSFINVLCNDKASRQVSLHGNEDSFDNRKIVFLYACLATRFVKPSEYRIWGKVALNEPAHLFLAVAKQIR